MLFTEANSTLPLAFPLLTDSPLHFKQTIILDGALSGALGEYQRGGRAARFRLKKLFTNEYLGDKVQRY
jgi:hypothetical protein